MPIEIIKKICPITFGLPTKMTQQGFERFCWEKQHNVVRTYNGTKNGRKTHPVCAVCKGDKPAELEIVILEEKSMTLGTKPGDGLLCSGEEQPVALDHPAAMRAPCQALSAATSQWTEADGQTCDHMRDGEYWLGRADACLEGEQSEAEGYGERETPINKFAVFQEALGFSAGKDGVATLTAVAVLTQEFDRLRKRCEELVESLATQEKELAWYRRVLDQAPPAAMPAVNAGSI